MSIDFGPNTNGHHENNLQGQTFGSSALPQPEIFEDEQRKYENEIRLYGGKWVARDTSGEIIVATEELSDLDNEVKKVIGTAGTSYTPERIFKPEEFEAEKKVYSLNA